MILEAMTEARELPPLKTRRTMMKILQEKAYGYLPPANAATVSFSDLTMVEDRVAPNGAHLQKTEMMVENEYGSHHFPVHYQSMGDGRKHPLFICLSFERQVPNRYYPIEIIAERGFNVLSFCYTDATADNPDFQDGIAPLLLPNGQQTGSDCGKIAMWAWCAIRLLDYAANLPETDMNQIAVIGHSRLGKTALYAGMMDTRFRYVFSNNAGCAGDALTRGSLGVLKKKGPYGNTGETIRHNLMSMFPYWFCKNFRQYEETNITTEFDQHYLLAAIAPRYVSVSASAEDDWADPVSEQLCCVAAGEQWKQLGLPGFVHKDRLLEPGEVLQEGRVAFQMREGKHHLSYHNWMWNMDFIEKHRNEKI